MTPRSQTVGGQCGTDCHAGPTLNLDWIWAVGHHIQCACFLEDLSAKCLYEAIGLVYKYHLAQYAEGVW